MEIADFARFGRLHPLVLHLPIGFLLAALLFEVLASRGKVTRPAFGLFLWLAALSAVVGAATGWTLAHEEGYGGATLERHEQLGIALAICAVVAALAHDASGRSRWRLGLHRSALVVACALLLPAGHLGSELTHGVDWLAGPRARSASASGGASERAETRAQEDMAAAEGTAAPVPLPETAPSVSASGTYAAVIRPLLEARCTACHGAAKHKGGLRLDSPEAMLVGGDSGPALVPGDPGASHMLQRAKTPLEHEDHMPPEGKPQPTPEELAALEAWIAASAPF